jgi:23S rRNA pseudouridine2605 synthase
LRLNSFVARATGVSRRAADGLIAEGRVTVNGSSAVIGQTIDPAIDQITLNGKALSAAPKLTVMLNKPAGYVVSRSGQGSRTIYDLLPAQLHALKPVGRLDKESSGLLLLTNDGELADRLTHPRYKKLKIYRVKLDRVLAPPDRRAAEQGIELPDGLSRLQLEPIGRDGRRWQVTLGEGRNRQIRRTFAALGYRVTALQRTAFGPYDLGDLTACKWQAVNNVSES